MGCAPILGGGLRLCAPIAGVCLKGCAPTAEDLRGVRVDCGLGSGGLCVDCGRGSEGVRADCGWWSEGVRIVCGWRLEGLRVDCGRRSGGLGAIRGRVVVLRAVWRYPCSQVSNTEWRCWALCVGILASWYRAQGILLIIFEYEIGFWFPRNRKSSFEIELVFCWSSFEIEISTSLWNRAPGPQ